MIHRLASKGEMISTNTQSNKATSIIVDEDRADASIEAATKNWQLVQKVQHPISNGLLTFDHLINQRIRYQQQEYMLLFHHISECQQPCPVNKHCRWMKDVMKHVKKGCNHQTRVIVSQCGSCLHPSPVVSTTSPARNVQKVIRRKNTMIQMGCH